MIERTILDDDHAFGHHVRVSLIVNLTWGDSWRRPKEGLGRVVDEVADAAALIPKPKSPEDRASSSTSTCREPYGSTSVRASGWAR